MSEKKSKERNAGKICCRVQVPTEEELNALNAMRLIKKRVHEIRHMLSRNLTGDDRLEKIRLKKELDRLKTEWKEWVEKRENATKERMIALGHEKP